MINVANVTVAIATLNRPDAVARCLDAILSAELLPAEVIIVDQSETETTRGIIAQRQGSAIPIMYIRQRQRGLSISRNTAFARANYPIVAMTDDDCVPDRKWITTIAQNFESSSAPDAVTGRILPLGPERPDTYEISSRRSTTRREFEGNTLPWLVGSGGNCAVKRSLFQQIGGYDERLGAGSPGKAAEDMDFFYRLLRAQARIRYEPQAVIYHERQNRARRLASRYQYGHGMGAFCAIWLRRGDAHAFVIIARWTADLLLAYMRAIVHLNWPLAKQRWYSLQGTVGGVLYGLTVRKRQVTNNFEQHYEYSERF